MNLRDQLKEILPEILPTNPADAIKGTEFEGKSLEEIVKGSFGKNSAVFNNAGQHYNHLHFWNWMKPNGGGKKMPSALEKSITESFGDFDAFREQFIQAGMTQFGSGWAWLILKEDGTLAVSSTQNQDNPLMDVVAIRGQPLLAVDVWEHAYYLKYQNRRADYLAQWWRVVNWNEVNARFVRYAQNKK